MSFDKMSKRFWALLFVWLLMGLVLPIPSKPVGVWFAINAFGGLILCVSSLVFVGQAVEGAVYRSKRPNSIPSWRKSWCPMSRIDFSGFRMEMGLMMMVSIVVVPIRMLL